MEKAYREIAETFHNGSIGLEILVNVGDLYGVG